MKKSFIIPLITPFLLVGLTGCLGNTKKSEEIQSSNQVQQQTLTGSATGSVASTGATQSGSNSIIKEEPKPTIKTLGINKYNVVLLEEGKIIKKLTQKGNTNTLDLDLCSKSLGGEQYFTYKLLSKSGTYGVVKRDAMFCGADRGFSSYFAMNLTDGSIELTDISKYIPNDSEVSFMNDKLVATISGDMVVNSETEMGMGTVLASVIKKIGFVKQGKNWVNTINLEKTLPKPKK